MYIDSHCHLNHDRLLHIGGAAQAVKNARAAGVEGMLTISCRIRGEFPQILEMVRGLESVWCTVGTHPHDAGLEAEKAVREEEIAAIVRDNPKVVGIGESGLDYYYKHSTPVDQQESFRKHIRACIAADAPLVVHSRDAEEDTMRIIREEGQGSDLKGVMHCFSSKRILAEEALEFGFYISFSGIVTFKKSEELREIARDVPLDRLLIETDAPFLAPEPERKRINEPAYVIETAKVLAGLYAISEEEIASITKQNFFDLFKKAVN